VLTARPRADHERRYICAKGPGNPGCGAIAVLAEPLEAFITEAVLYRLDTPALAAALAGKIREDEAAAASHARLEKDNAQLAELADAYGQQFISLAEYLAARVPIQRRIDAARRELSRLTQTSAVGRYVGAATVLRQAWPDLPLTRQHAVVAAILDHAVVSPAVRGRSVFDPQRVSPLWRL
jgi:hypothetical protein